LGDKRSGGSGELAREFTPAPRAQVAFEALWFRQNILAQRRLDPE
jgi:hypothetical protein